MKNIIAGKKIGPNEPVFIIAEIGQAHDGSLGMAHAYINAVAETKVDAIKFQTHFASEESTYDDEFRVQFSKQDETRFDYWKRMEFTEHQWIELAAHAKEKSLIFLSSAFSTKALDLLIKLGIPAIKIASGEISNQEMLDKVISSKLPAILSTGMSNWGEIEKSVTYLKGNNIPVFVMQCTSEYPTPLSHVGLNILDNIKERLGTPVGLSDHSGMIFPSIAAISRGIDILEVHVTFNKKMFGPDTLASITLDELKFLANYRDALRKMDDNPVDKDRLANELSGMRELFSKSLVTVMPLKKGTILKKNMLTTKKPGTGIKPTEINEIIGCRLKRDVTPERLLRREDIDG